VRWAFLGGVLPTTLLLSILGQESNITLIDMPGDIAISEVVEGINSWINKAAALDDVTAEV